MGVVNIRVVVDGSQQVKKLPPKQSSKSHGLFQQARKEFSLAISADDVTAFKNVALKYKDLIPIESQELSMVMVPGDVGCSGKSLLQEALEKDKKAVVLYIVARCHISYFQEGYSESAKKESKRIMMASLSKKRKTYLHLMIETGHKEAVEKMIGRLKGAYFGLNSIHNSSWLRMTFSFGLSTQEEGLDEFLNAKVSYETKDRRKRHGGPFHYAVITNQWKLFESLKRFGLSIDEKDSEQETPLMLSIQQYLPEAFRELIRLGANLNAQNNKDTAALHMAIGEGKDDMVELLVAEDSIDLNVERIKNPRWAVEMASKANNAKVVGWLLDRKNSKGHIFKANVHQALLIAASNGFDEVIKVMLERLPKLLNKPDDFGNTPVMLATDSGKLQAVKLLVEMPDIDLDKKNNLGHSVFDLAMKLEDESVLIFLLGRVEFNEALDSFYVHTAVANGKVDRLKLLLANDHQLEKLYLLEEHTENSVYHTAAAFNSFEVIKLFLDENDGIKDLQNKDDETASHVAVRRNNIEAMRNLLEKKVRVDIQDSEGQNILHAAVTNRSTGMEIFEILLEAFQKVDPSLVNEQESNGNTVLHLCAMYNKPEMLRKLEMCDPEIENKDGETALHLAARLGSTEAVRILLQMFYTDMRANIDRRDELGFSALYRSAEEGNREKYELLMSCGADMGLSCEGGPSILHRLVECCKADPNRAEKYANVYRATVQWSVVWYCRKKGLRCPLPNTNQYYLMQLQAVKLLTNDTLYENCNVLQYAARRGESTMLRVILETPNVYRFDKSSRLKLERQPDTHAGSLRNSSVEPNDGELIRFLEEKSSLPTNTVLYDVTYLVPGHFPDDHERKVRFAKGVENVVKDRRKSQVSSRSNTSCLEYLVDTCQESDINEILSSEPFHSLVYTYWRLCRRGYELLMWTHVFYMVLFTYFVIPDAAWIKNRFHSHELSRGDVQSAELQNYNLSSGVGSGNGGEDVFVRNWFSIQVFASFLVWPTLILLYEIVVACHFIVDMRRKDASVASCRYELVGRLQVGEITSGLMRIPVGLMLFVFDNLSHISSISFTLSCAVWYASCVYSVRLQSYLECLAIFLISGWLHTINYVKGFKDWNALANILKTILIKDLTRFIYIYIFVLVSFGYAIHVLIQVNVSDRADDTQLSSSSSTLFLAFYQMLSPGNVLDTTETPLYWQGGKHAEASMLRAVYATYSILSTVVLMNMLIAMMNSTYSDVKSVRLTAWRVESLRMAVWLEKHFILVRRLKLVRFKAKFDKWQNRWFMKKAPDEPDEIKNQQDFDPLDPPETDKPTDIGAKEVSKITHDLTRKLGQLKNEIDGMSEALNSYEKKSVRVFNGLNTEFKLVHELCLESYHLARVSSRKMKK